MFGCGIFFKNISKPDKKVRVSKKNYTTSNFQKSERDFAFVIDKLFKVGELENIIKKIDDSIVKKVITFDVFEGQNIPEGKKSVGIIFDNPVNLAKHINENYKNINKWWDNKAVIDARENFVKKYSRKTPKNLNLLKSMAQILNSSLNDSFESNEK